MFYKYSCSSCRRGCFPGGLQQTSRVNIHKITVPRRRYVALSASSSLFSKDMFLLALRATFKLAVGCSGIMLLMKAGRIPSTAPQVLSQLGFNVTIPAMLFIKSAETLAAAQDARYLLVPLITALEVRPSCIKFPLSIKLQHHSDTSYQACTSV